MNKIEKLQDELSKRTTDPFETGDVIRWLSGGRYHYAALKTPVGWFTTSASDYNVFVPKQVEYEELVDILAKANATDVLLASGWTELEK